MKPAICRPFHLQSRDSFQTLFQSLRILEVYISSEENHTSGTEPNEASREGRRRCTSDPKPFVGIGGGMARVFRSKRRRLGIHPVTPIHGLFPSTRSRSLYLRARHLTRCT